MLIYNFFKRILKNIIDPPLNEKYYNKKIKGLHRDLMLGEIDYSEYKVWYDIYEKQLSNLKN